MDPTTGAGGRRLDAWLRMEPVVGPYPVPTSEAAYYEHSESIDIASPVHGGTLQADGSWAQSAARLNNAFAQALPGLAETARQCYAPVMNPGHGIGTANLYAVLDNPALQTAAANELVWLATVGRFDSPWDAVVYDVIGTSQAYGLLHENFINLLSTSVRGAGLSFYLACPGPRPAATVLPRMRCMAEMCDHFTFYCYNWQISPYANHPHWWIKGCIDFALNGGIEVDDFSLGLPLFSRYWPTPGNYATSVAVTHEQALVLVAAAGSTLQWVEAYAGKTVREQFADLGVSGRMWASDGDTVQDRLGFIDQYWLGGVMLFALGMGDTTAWDAVVDWKPPPANCGAEA